MVRSSAIALRQHGASGPAHGRVSGRQKGPRAFTHLYYIHYAERTGREKVKKKKCPDLESNQDFPNTYRLLPSQLGMTAQHDLACKPLHHPGLLFCLLGNPASYSRISVQEKQTGKLGSFLVYSNQMETSHSKLPSAFLLVPGYNGESSCGIYICVNTYLLVLCTSDNPSPFKNDIDETRRFERDHT